MKEVRDAKNDAGMEGTVMQAQARQTQKEELKRELLEEMTPVLDNLAMATTESNKKYNEIAAMTAGNVTLTSKLDALMADNARMKTKMEAMEQGVSTGTVETKTEWKTETAPNSNEKHCAIRKGSGKHKNF